MKISKFTIFSHIRRKSDKIQCETLFVEIGWEFFEVFDLGYLLGPGCAKKFLRNKMQSFEETLKRFTDPQSVHQDLSFELWTTTVGSIWHNLPCYISPGIPNFTRNSLDIDAIFFYFSVTSAKKQLPKLNPKYHKDNSINKTSLGHRLTELVFNSVRELISATVA